jgi:Spy/CpxP family protein refolding chaperone
MLRRTLLMTGVALAVASIATLASAQPGGGGFGGGFGFGGGMGGGSSIAGLLSMPAVQTELKVTDEQKTKIQDLRTTMRDKMREAMNSGDGPPDFQNMSQEERQKAMGEMRKKMQPITKEFDEQAVKILDADQVARAKQLQLQREGGSALAREEVAKKLELTDDQTSKVKKLQESLAKPPQFDPNGDMQAQFQKMRENVTKTQKDMLAVLTDEQTTKWKEMCGKPFTFPQGRGFGRGGAGARPAAPGGGGPGGGGGN